MLAAISVAACSAPEDPTVCQPVGDNYLQDADFAMEQQNPRTNNAWITLPVDERILFEMPLEDRWHAVWRQLGVDPVRMSHVAGHA